MSVLPILSSAAAALPALNGHPHRHKGLHVGSAGDFGSDTAAQVPAGAAKNLFGSLLQTLEQAIGLQSSAATAAPNAAAHALSAATVAPSSTTASGRAVAADLSASTAVGSRTGAGAASVQSAISLLQNY